MHVCIQASLTLNYLLIGLSCLMSCVSCMVCGMTCSNVGEQRKNQPSDAHEAIFSECCCWVSDLLSTHEHKGRLCYLLSFCQSDMRVYN